MLGAFGGFRGSNAPWVEGGGRSLETLRPSSLLFSFFLPFFISRLCSGRISDASRGLEREGSCFRTGFQYASGGSNGDGWEDGWRDEWMDGWIDGGVPGKHPEIFTTRGWDSIYVQGLVSCNKES